MIAPFELPQPEENNPLDLVEELAEARGWTFSREDEEFLIITLKGLKGVELEACLEWQDEFSAVLFACTIPVEITEAQYEIAARTIEKINQNVWLGHFDLSNKGKFPTFRHTLLFRMIPAGIAVDIMNDVLEIALAECNRFMTTFELVRAGVVAMQENLQAAIFETIGEA